MQLRTAVERRYFAWRLLTKLPEHRLTVRTEYGKFSFSSKDREIGRQLFLYKSFDFEKTKKFQQLLTELGYLRAGYLVDVGANVGTVCIPLVRNGVFPRALALEPEPRNYSLLVKNIAQNGLRSMIRPFECALSDSEAHVEMELSIDNYGDHRVRMQNPTLFRDEQFTESGRRTIQVYACPLDHVLKRENIRPSEIAALWLDVQGHEKYVLEGAESVLASGAPVLAEFWPYGLLRAGVTPESFCDFLSVHFNFFYDLNSEPVTRENKKAFVNLFERYQGISFTDLLLVP
jgi:FkbM family methyltransferase